MQGLKFSPKHPWLLAGALALLAVMLTFDPKLYINGDNVDYMNLARGVRQGHLWASDKYPPLFPMLLAPVQALFGMRLLPQKILVTLFAAGAIGLRGIVRRRTGPGPALGSLRRGDARPARGARPLCHERDSVSVLSVGAPLPPAIG